MRKIELKSITKLDILEAITFGRDLFDTIANDTHLDDPTTNGLSRKRYYTRLTRLVKADLIKRKNGRYVLTLFGKVIYEVQLGFRTAVDDHLKLLQANSTITA